MVSELQSMADELLNEPKQKVNNLPKLVASLTQPSETVLRSLQKYFLGAFERGDLSSKQPAGVVQQRQQTPEAVFEAWLHRQYVAYLSALLALMSSPVAGARAQLAALAALMECVRGEEPGVLNNELYWRVLRTATSNQGVQPEVLGLLVAKYAGYADVRYHTLRAIVKIAEENAKAGGAPGDGESDEEGAPGAATGGNTDRPVSPHDLARTLHDLLTQLPAFEDADQAGLSSWCGAAEVGVVGPASDADGSRQRKKRKLEAVVAGAAVQRAKWASAKLQRKALSDAWLAFLRLDLPDDIFKRVLTKLHDTIMPALFNPLLLADFLTHSLDRGGLIGMLALNGIFVLVTQHGLEYPNFYTRLYALLEPDAFQAKYRARFFQLADIFLASNMVPAYTAASFAKKFARLAMSSSPAGSLVALAFVHNIIRRHPACLQMLHRPPRASATNTAGLGSAGASKINGQPSGEDGQEQALLVYSGLDVYDPAEPDPAQSRAIESSLWELEALRVHAMPSVAAFCGTLEKDLSDRRKTAEVDVADLSTLSYSSMFVSEAERRIKVVPTAFYQRAPHCLFDANSATDFAGWC